MSSEAENGTVPPSLGRILVVGGSGQVGRLVAERLASLFPGRVAVAGRDLDRATRAAAAIGHGAAGLSVDVSDPKAGDALDGVALVVACLNQTDTRFVEQCLRRGIHYIDISADDDYLARVERLDELAARQGSTAVLSVGVAPGLTNMLAARAVERMDVVDRIDIVLEFGLGDEHGSAALGWMLDNLDAEYEVKEDGWPRSVRSFGENLKIRLPGQEEERAAYRFNFSDQHALGRTLDVPSVSTWVRFESRLVTWLSARAAQAGLGRVLRRRRWRKIALWLLTNIHTGSDACRVAVKATGRTGDGAETLTLGLSGRQEALMTAAIAAEAARQVLADEPAPGVHHSHQAIDFDSVIDALRADLPDLVIAR